MIAEPWSKFFWSDYDSDEGLRLCSLAAQGLWMRMLCLMARATPKGELRVGGKPCSVQDLARSVSESDVTVQHLLNELEDRGVYSVTRAGVIFCRRMRKDAEISRKRAENGKKGAIVTNGKQSEPEICRGKIAANASAKSRPQKPEARIQKDNNPAQLPIAARAGPELAPDPGNDLDRLTAKCSAALGTAAPADAVIGPMLPLVEAFGERRVLETLASEARRPRRKPIRTWALWAEILRGEMAASPPIAAPPPGEELVEYDHGRRMTVHQLEVVLRRYAERPDSWLAGWGPPPPENPRLMRFAAERGIELPEVAQ